MREMREMGKMGKMGKMGENFHRRVRIKKKLEL
jgi:hypothetical protein